jgi:hypothetical protein
LLFPDQEWDDNLIIGLQVHDYTKSLSYSSFEDQVWMKLNPLDESMCMQV